MKVLFTILYILTLSALKFSISNAQDGKPLIFSGSKAKLEIQTAGSAITHFSLNKHNINPFTWTLLPDQMPKPNTGGPVFRGHFLCMGRWGAASEAEQRAGIPHNGEINTLNWKTLKSPTIVGDRIVAESECQEIKEQMKVSRKIELQKDGQSFLMTETATNTANLDRVYNFTQHPTIGAPFLSPSTLIDCNATLGFDQRADYTNLEKSEFTFPEGHLTDGFADLRKVNDDRGYVSTHIFNDTTKIGWVTATNPDQKLVLGYIFLTKEYPWLNLWHWKKDRAPFAHGLEFGTTGLGQPYKTLIDNCVTFHGRKSYEWIETGQSITKKYVCFLTEVPESFAGVSNIKFVGEKAYLIERKAEKPRKVELNLIQGLK
jgi:hypothetical protein